MIVQELLTRLGFTVDKTGIEKGKSALEEFKGFAMRIGAGVGFAILGKGAMDTATQMEDLNIQFKTLLQSQEQATAMMKEVTAFAAETPYELPELAAATKGLLAYKIANEKIMPTLRSIGDISAGLKIPIGELAAIYGKAKTQGTLYAEDINQMTGRGIPIIQEFAKQLRVPESRVKELASKGKISFKNLEQAFTSLTSEGGQFNGMMSELAKTTSGKTSTALDNVKMAAGNMMTQFLPLYKRLLDLVIAIDFTPMVEMAKSAATAITYLADVVWNSGLSDAFETAKIVLGEMLEKFRELFPTTAGVGSMLTTLGQILAVVLSAFVYAAVGAAQLVLWFSQLAKWVYDNSELLFGLGVVMAALFGPVMIARILATGSALRIVALMNMFLQRAALAGGAATGYQVTMLGLLKASLFGVQGGFMRAAAAARVFAMATIGTMGLAFAAVASVGFAVYRVWQAVQEKRELEEAEATEEKKAQIAEQILENTKEWRRAKDRGDTATMAEMDRRIKERRAAYHAMSGQAKDAIADNSFPSFDAMMKAGTGSLDVMMQKTTEAGSRSTVITNNMDFTVNAEAKDGKVGLDAQDIAELAAQAARATFQIELQNVTVGLL